MLLSPLLSSSKIVAESVEASTGSDQLTPEQATEGGKAAEILDTQIRMAAVKQPEYPQYPPIVTKPADDPIWQKFSTGWGKEEAPSFLDDPDMTPEERITRVTGFTAGPLDKVVLGLAERNIPMVEWHVLLFRRYRVPYCISDPVYLIPDDRLEEACSVCIKLGLEPSQDGREFDTSSPTLAHGRRSFVINRKPLFCYLKLIPLSWTGLSTEDSIPVVQKPKILLDNYRTLPLHTALATLAKLGGREKKSVILNDLAIIAGHYLFDLDCVTPVIGEPPVYKEETAIDRHRAFHTIQSWSWKNDEIWVKDMLCLYVLREIRQLDFQRICQNHVESNMI